MRTADFDYDLPPDLIAQTPLERRDASRLLVLDRASGSITHSAVERLPDFLRTGDLLVANNSRVLAARLQMRKADSGGRVELLLLHPRSDGTWESLARPARRLKIGQRLVVDGSDFGAEVAERLREGLVQLRLDPELIANLDRVGAGPLPPYIH
jgi:S-adenosylmethionine:tRNA ribosyltransferase-isomerase